MASLYVYSTEGECLHPVKGADDPSINQYFEAINFTANLRTTSQPTIEAYARVLLQNGRPEQVFLRYQGDSHETIFEDCRNAIQDELIDRRGWQIRQTQDKIDASMVLQTAVMNPPADPAAELTSSPIDQIRKYLSTSGVTEALEVTARDYGTIGTLVRALDEQSILFVVSEGNVSPNDADIVVKRQSQSSPLAFSNHSTELLRQYDGTKTAAASPAIEPALEEIGAQLEELQSSGADASTVKSRLNEVISQRYPELEVNTKQVGRISAGQASGGSENERSSSSIPGLTPTPGSDDEESTPIEKALQKVRVGSRQGVTVLQKVGVSSQWAVVILVFFVLGIGAVVVQPDFSKLIAFQSAPVGNGPVGNGPTKTDGSSNPSAALFYLSASTFFIYRSFNIGNQA